MSGSCHFPWSLALLNSEEGLSDAWGVVSSTNLAALRRVFLLVSHCLWLYNDLKRCLLANDLLLKENICYCHSIWLTWKIASFQFRIFLKIYLENLNEDFSSLKPAIVFLRCLHYPIFADFAPRDFDSADLEALENQIYKVLSYFAKAQVSAAAASSAAPAKPEVSWAGKSCKAAARRHLAASEDDRARPQKVEETKRRASWAGKAGRKVKMQ